MPNLLDLPPFADEDAGIVHVLVESPAGSPNKYDYDEALGALILDRPIHSALRYPGDYGCVPGTLSEDGDALDAIVLAQNPTVPGCVVRSRVLGVLRMEDEDGPDPKLVCVPARDPRTADFHSIEDLPAHTRAELEHFFTRIKDLEPEKWARVAGYESRRAALDVVREAAQRAAQRSPGGPKASKKPRPPKKGDLAPAGVPARDHRPGVPAPRRGPTATGGARFSPLGCVSGRFQPFHAEHLAYAIGALARCERLYVGITNPDPDAVRADQASGHRHTDAANPYPFHFRAEMIRAALLEAGVAEERFRIVPLSLHHPDRIRAYIPAQAIHWITVYDEEPWGDRKLTLLREAGYQAEILWRRPTKGMTSTQVRQRLQDGEDLGDLVPPAVKDLLATWSPA